MFLSFSYNKELHLRYYMNTCTLSLIQCAFSYSANHGIVTSYFIYLCLPIWKGARNTLYIVSHDNYILQLNYPKYFTDSTKCPLKQSVHVVACYHMPQNTWSRWTSHISNGESSDKSSCYQTVLSAVVIDGWWHGWESAGWGFDMRWGSPLPLPNAPTPTTPVRRPVAPGVTTGPSAHPSPINIGGRGVAAGTWSVFTWCTPVGAGSLSNDKGAPVRRSLYKGMALYWYRTQGGVSDNANLGVNNNNIVVLGGGGGPKIAQYLNTFLQSRPNV